MNTVSVTNMCKPCWKSTSQCKLRHDPKHHCDCYYSSRSLHSRKNVFCILAESYRHIVYSFSRQEYYLIYTTPKEKNSLYISPKEKNFAPGSILLLQIYPWYALLYHKPPFFLICYALSLHPISQLFSQFLIKTHKSTSSLLFLMHQVSLSLKGNLRRSVEVFKLLWCRY